MRIAAVLAVSLLAFGGLRAAAQEDEALHAPDRRAPQLIAPLVFPATPGAPFMAIAKTVWVRNLGNGATVTAQNERVVARDGQGRVFEERRSFVPAGGKGQSIVVAQDYIDPVQHTTTHCVVGPKVCTLHTFFGPAKIEERPAGMQPNGSTYLSREDLGVDTFAGQNVRHSRETTTLAAGTVGNTGTILRTCEYWYSPALGINLQVARHDPRDGDQTLWLTDLTLSAPSPDTFSPPSGYRMIDMRGSVTSAGGVVGYVRPPNQ